MTGPLSKMEARMNTFASSTEANAARMERSLRKVEKTSFNISKGAAVLGTAILLPLGASAKAAADFEKQMGNINTLLDSSKENINTIGDELLVIAQKIPKPIEELTAGLYDIRSAGIPAAQAMMVLEDSGKLATAGLSTTQEATNIMTSALNSFKSEALTSAQVSDILFKTVKAGKTTISELAQGFGATAPIVQAAGASLEDFQAATAALTTAGTPAAQAQTQIRAAMVALQKPTKEMSAIMHRLGVKDSQALIDKYGNMGAAFDAINKKGTSMGLNLAKAWSSVEAAAAVTSLTGATGQSYIQTLDDMTKGSNAVDEAFRKQMETEAAQAQIAENSIKALNITLGTGLLPIINDLLKEVTPIIQHFTDWVKRNRETTNTILKVAAGVGALSLAVSGVSFTIGIFSKVMRIATAAQWLFNSAILANPVTWIIAGIVALIATIAIVVSKIGGWGEQWQSIIEWMGNVFKTFKLSLLLQFKMLEHGFLTMVDGIVLAWKWMQNKLGVLSDEQYERDKARIAAEKKMRIDSIKDTAKELAAVSDKALQGPEMKLFLKSGAKNDYSNEDWNKSNTPYPARVERKVVNMQAIQNEAFVQRIENTQRSTVDINVKAQPGTAEVQRSPNAPNVKLVPTLGAY